jgi:hypothetical protein
MKRYTIGFLILLPVCIGIWQLQVHSSLERTNEALKMQANRSPSRLSPLKHAVSPRIRLNYLLPSR